MNDNPKKKLPTSTVIIVPCLPPSSEPENLEVQVPNNKFKFRKEINNTGEANVAANKDKQAHRRSKSRPENAASAPRAEGNFVEQDVPLKTRRTGRRAASSHSNSAPLWDRNAASKSDEPEVFETRNAVRYKRTLDEKENNNKR